MVSVSSLRGISAPGPESLKAQTAMPIGCVDGLPLDAGNRGLRVQRECLLLAYWVMQFDYCSVALFEHRVDTGPFMADSANLR